MLVLLLIPVPELWLFELLFVPAIVLVFSDTPAQTLAGAWAGSEPTGARAIACVPARLLNQCLCLHCSGLLLAAVLALVLAPGSCPPASAPAPACARGTPICSCSYVGTVYLTTAPVIARDLLPVLLPAPLLQPRLVVPLLAPVHIRLRLVPQPVLAPKFVLLGTFAGACT